MRSFSKLETRKKNGGREKASSNLPYGMNGKSISVTMLNLKPGLEELLLPDLTQIIDATRQIPGCICFDLYRLRQDQSVLILHETWETIEAQQGYAFGPLKAQLSRQLVEALAQTPQTWDVEEVR